MKKLAVVSAVLLASSTSAFAAGFEVLKPHRATYDVKMTNAEDRSGIKAMSGRIVYEVTGNECEGISVDYRFVTQINTGRSSFVTDHRTSTHESPDGGEFSFTSDSFVNEQPDQKIVGNAKLLEDGLSVTLGVAEKRELKLEKALFATTHLVDVLKNAKNGNAFVSHNVFDGSGDADKVMNSASVIGKPRLYEDVQEGETKDAVNKLLKREAWPVTMSYFFNDKGNAGEGIPFYEASFFLYNDGVSRELEMRYPDYTLEASLTNLEYLSAKPCQLEN